MRFELVVYNAVSKMKYDYTDVVQEVGYTTNRTNSPGKLEFSYIEQGQISITEGSQIRFTVGSNNIFKGYAFIISQDREGVVNVTAYDQLRYMKAKASYAFTGKTLGDIIKKIAADFDLKVGILEDTKYRIPTLTKEDKSCLDIIDYGLQLTQTHTGKTFVFYDDFGELCLREAKNMIVSNIIGDASLLTGYNFKSDIDSETYNQVKLVRPNKESGKGDVYIFKDSSNQKKWGLLQYYEKVDEDLNVAQIKEHGNILMAYYDRVLKSISVDCIGIPGLRAGSLVCFQIDNIPELQSGYFLLADKVTHKFKSGEHVMSIDAKIVNTGGVASGII